MADTQNFHMISLENYPRLAHFNYFKDMAYPYTGVTVNVDVTRLRKRHEETGEPFFLSLLYYVTQAANAIPAFRQRIVESGIAEYDYCRSSHTVARADGTYAYCTLDGRLPFYEYISRANTLQDACKRGGSIEEDADVLSYLFITTLPWLNYTALVQAVPSPADSNPRISWGRYCMQGGHALLPMTVLCHHALVDGRQIADFYARLDALLEQI